MSSLGNKNTGNKNTRNTATTVTKKLRVRAPKIAVKIPVKQKWTKTSAQHAAMVKEMKKQTADVKEVLQPAVTFAMDPTNPAKKKAFQRFWPSRMTLSNLKTKVPFMLYLLHYLMLYAELYPLLFGYLMPEIQKIPYIGRVVLKYKQGQNTYTMVKNIRENGTFKNFGMGAAGILAQTNELHRQLLNYPYVKISGKLLFNAVHPKFVSDLADTTAREIATLPPDQAVPVLKAIVIPKFVKSFLAITKPRT